MAGDQHGYFTLREAQSADYPQLRALDERLVIEAALPGAIAADFEHFQSVYTEAALAGPGVVVRIIVAVDAAENVLGYVHLQDADDAVLRTKIGYVTLLAVAENAAGQGIGRALMTAAEDWAKSQGYPALILDVFASNATARRFYAAQGFVEDSLRLRKVV
jgi:ribosomal protein S18 acetylase RimI-like enzyme